MVTYRELARASRANALAKLFHTLGVQYAPAHGVEPGPDWTELDADHKKLVRAVAAEILERLDAARENGQAFP